MLIISLYGDAHSYFCTQDHSSIGLVRHDFNGGGTAAYQADLTLRDLGKRMHNVIDVLPPYLPPPSSTGEGWIGVGEKKEKIRK